MAISEVIVGGVTYDKTDRAKDTGRFNVGSFSGNLAALFFGNYTSRSRWNCSSFDRSNGSLDALF